MSTNAFGARRLKGHHTITEKRLCRDATMSHPYTARNLGNCLEGIQSKAVPKCNYASR